MRFLLTIIPGPKYMNAPPSPEMGAAIGKLVAEIQEAGILLDTGGMGVPSPRVKLAGGKISFTDGPYAESKEMIGGYAIVQVASLEQVVAMTQRFLEVHREVDPDYEAENIIQRLYGPWDCDAGATERCTAAKA